MADSAEPSQKRLSFAEIDSTGEIWEYAALVTSLTDEILTLGQLYRDRADCENTFDELKNQWGWGGFTTQDLKRCRLLAGVVALIYNWWSLFARLGEPEHHREAITTRPLLLTAIARRTQHAGQVTLTISSTHGKQHLARRAYLRIAGFLAELRNRRGRYLAAVMQNTSVSVDGLSTAAVDLTSANGRPLRRPCRRSQCVPAARRHYRLCHSKKLLQIIGLVVGYGSGGLAV